MLMDLVSPLFPSAFLFIVCLGSLSRSFSKFQILWHHSMWSSFIYGITIILCEVESPFLSETKLFKSISKHLHLRCSKLGYERQDNKNISRMWKTSFHLYLFQANFTFEVFHNKSVHQHAPAECCFLAYNWCNVHAVLKSLWLRHSYKAGFEFH